MTNFMRFMPNMPSSSLLSSSPYKFYSIVNHTYQSVTYNQMFVRRNERHITQLPLQVHPQSFDPVPHTISRSHTRQILQKVRQCSLVRRLLKILIVGNVSFRLNFCQLFTRFRISVLVLLLLWGWRLTDTGYLVVWILGCETTRLRSFLLMASRGRKVLRICLPRITYDIASATYWLNLLHIMLSINRD